MLNVLFIKYGTHVFRKFYNDLSNYKTIILILMLRKTFVKTSPYECLYTYLKNPRTCYFFFDNITLQATQVHLINYELAEYIPETVFKFHLE